VKNKLFKCRSGQFSLFLFLFLLGLIGPEVAAQDSDQTGHFAGVTKKPAQTVPPSLPTLKAFREVSIGMTAKSVRDAWGKPKVKDDDGYYYELSDSEIAQVRFDADQKVTVISITFDKGPGAPTLNDVFGIGAVPDTTDGEKLYKMVRYPDAGYWIAYYVGPGPKPKITLTFQKL
jgi:hypothetical protein